MRDDGGADFGCHVDWVSFIPQPRKSFGRIYTDVCNKSMGDE
jgi:hypothetical protein